MDAILILTFGPLSPENMFKSNKKTKFLISMVEIPILVQDFNLRNLTNAVIVDTAKFTRDQFNQFFTSSNPAPAKLSLPREAYMPPKA